MRRKNKFILACGVVLIIALIALSLSILIIVNSCYYCETENTEKYSEFYTEMSKNGIADLLPDPILKEYIDDTYLYYSDWDLLDSFYSIYVNCNYTEELYYEEVKRISSVFTDESALVKNSESFDCDSLMYYCNLVFEPKETSGIMHYDYVLFDESDFRIIYVKIFDKQLYGKSINIPIEYLPKELVGLRNQ